MTGQPAGFTSGIADRHRIAARSDGTSQVARFPAWHRSSCLRPVRAGLLNLMASAAPGRIGQPPPSHLLY